MQVRSFVFTWNNYPEDAIESIRGIFFDCRYLVIGKEVGLSGTNHLQGYCQLNKRKTLKVLGKLFPWHVEATRGTPIQAAEYCKKDNKFVEFGQIQTAEKGNDKSKNRWSDIIRLAKKGQFDNLESEFPSEYIRYIRSLHMIRTENLPTEGCVKTCLWIYGKPGCGKSRFAFDYDRDSMYAKTANKWWDGYKGQDTIILDDIGQDHKVLGYHLKRWTDRYPCVLEVKGTSVMASYKNFIVTSNYSFTDIFDDPEMVQAIGRRFTLIHITKHEETLEGLINIWDDNRDLWLNKFNHTNKIE